jgi:hypothetical protein
MLIELAPSVGEKFRKKFVWEKLKLIFLDEKINFYQNFEPLS